MVFTLKKKKKKQKIKISVKLRIRRDKSTDKISSTVCYQNVMNILENICKYKHINLVETLAEVLIEAFKEIKNVKKVIVKISKCEISQTGEDVGFTIKKRIE